MNLTLTQSIERTKDLSGELKAARAHEADCAADHEAKKRIAEIAGEAHVKAGAHCVTLEQEREDLADHIAALVRRTGEPLEQVECGGAAPPVYVSQEATPKGWGEPIPDPESPAFNTVFGGFDANDHAQRLMANGEAKVNEAFNKATS